MKTELIKRFENANILFNIGDFFSREINGRGFSILFNDELPEDPYLNFTTKINVKVSVDTFITEIESSFLSHNSKPSFYILPYTRPKQLEKILIKRKYKKFFTDVWMFFDLRKNVPAGGIDVRKIKKRELGDFKRVFNAVYMKGEKDDPYKNLSYMYGEFVERRFLRKEASCKTENYAAFIDNKMVGTIVIAHNKRDACLYALAVLPRYRKMGAGKSLIAKCVARANEMKLENLFLQTEKDSRNERIFSDMGFKTKFVGKQFCKSN